MMLFIIKSINQIKNGNIAYYTIVYNKNSTLPNQFTFLSQECYLIYLFTQFVLQLNMRTFQEVLLCPWVLANNKHTIVSECLNTALVIFRLKIHFFLIERLQIPRILTLKVTLIQTRKPLFRVSQTPYFYIFNLLLVF